MAFIRFTDVIEWNQARDIIVLHPIRKGRSLQKLIFLRHSLLDPCPETAH